MQRPPYLLTRIFPLPDDATDTLRERLLALPGVAEIAIFVDEKAIYCKVDSKIFDEASAHAVLTQA